MSDARQHAGQTQHAHASHKETFKETLISIVIAFALAFVFRGFVIEAFVIPTGSMAPTLKGAHFLAHSDVSGETWGVNPRDYFDAPAGAQRMPKPVQTIQASEAVHDPMTGIDLPPKPYPTLAGDRILVLKYLYAVAEPRRFDVVVFKNPTNPSENYIKRLIGLPGEELALVDGDVFVRPSKHPEGPFGGEHADWSKDGWRIARKPTYVQRAVWQEVFTSARAPLTDDPRFNPPWGSEDPGWTIGHQRSYEYSGTGPTTLEWENNRVFFRAGRETLLWQVDDRYPYNEGTENMTWRPVVGLPIFVPVSDVRMRAGIEPGVDGLSFSATVEARGHEFQAHVEGGRAEVRMRPVAAEGEPEAAWTVLGSGDAPALKKGDVANVEFWHVDQQLILWINGKRVASGEYSWSPAERIEYAYGESLDDMLRTEAAADPPLPNILAKQPPKPAEMRWEFSGGPLTLHRVALDRDLHYRADIYPPRSNSSYEPALGTHPDATINLSGDQFFVCGDNSPASQDGRLMGPPDPWAARIDPTQGVIARELLLGKAFFVYFPSLHRDGPLPVVPDFGRMRLIW